MSKERTCEEQRYRIYPRKKSPVLTYGPTHWVSGQIRNPHNEKEVIWSKKLVCGPKPE